MPPSVPTSTRLSVAAIPLLALLGGTDARAATGPAERGVDVRCLALQYREGAGAYRNCLTEGGARADSPLDELPFDERRAVERACAGSANGADCVTDQLEALERAPSPFLGALDPADRHALLRECTAAPAEDGVASYRRCLADALAALDALPAADTGTLTPLERDALERRCSDADGGAAGYRRCRLEALGTGAEGAAEPTGTDAPVADVADDPAGEPARGDESARDATAESPGPIETAAVEPRSAPRPTPSDEPSSTVGAARDAAAVEPPDDIAPEPSGDAGSPEARTEGEEAPDLRQRVEDARERLTAAVAGLDGTERIVLGAALALPLLLLGFWTVGRRRPPSRPVDDRSAGAPRNPALVDRLSPASYDDDFADDDFLGDLDAVGADEATPDPRARERRAFSAPEDDADEAPERAGAIAAEDHRGFVPRSAFGRWLLSEDAPFRRRHAIEFLIYWMAYGDERYDPGVRARLLAGGDDNDPHERIKRRALEEDTHAFADVVRWLQTNCGESERGQVIDLLMALLVGEEAMTPAQNTLLHFLADAFGLGAKGLDRRHEEAFGRPMPPLARADLAAWWHRVEAERLTRWDARAVAALDSRDQHRVRLGLPLEGELDDAAVIDAFRRAAGRCQPHRFDALGERERRLVERQLARIEEARDRLLEVRA